ncbi:hypothetical protein AQUCO_00900478v1 [Aquilegia coerulea]|uniref:Uncharacterized protein n=1 Tax=Aquilegia coerulea TaxID=218851 RepID=A0A2G5EDU2_AQUCA|nr:hypothetical protein AQUCO_00900478v1 [Aquilegia coerulea]
MLNVESTPKQDIKQYHIQNPLSGTFPNNKSINTDAPYTKSSQAELTESGTSRMTDEFIMWNSSSSPITSEIEEVFQDCCSIASSGLMKSDTIEKGELFVVSLPPPSLSSKNKSNSAIKSKVLLNLFTCGVIETNDSAMKIISKNSSSRFYRADETCEGKMFRRSGRISHIVHTQQEPPQDNSKLWGNCFNGVKNIKESCQFSVYNTLSATDKPPTVPSCLQCGKGFKPEKLLKHMQQCKGLKDQSKGYRNASPMVERTSAECTSAEYGLS